MNLEAQLKLSAFQGKILEAVATGSDFNTVADLMCREAETIAQGAICTVVRVEDGLLRPVAAPSLPDSYSQALDGAQIGPEAGSCGTAAYYGKPVQTTDIENDPKWQPYMGLVEPYGLKACWSSPIKTRDGRTVATFAFYFREKRGATAIERELVKRCVHLCTIAFEYGEVNARNEYLAYRDQLTGVGNRRSFDAAFHDPTLFANGFGLLLVDIDNLKIINDSLGHYAGDATISAIASRLAGLAGPDNAYRLGGDEFAIICRECRDHDTLRQRASMVLDAVTQPITPQQSTLTPSVTIGGVLSGADGTTPEQLRQNADMALYHAKESRRGGYVQFDQSHKNAIIRRLSETNELLEALDEDRVTAHYQPVVSLETGRIAGVEALARIRRRDGSIATASEFEMAFSDPPNTARLTARMIDLAFAELRGWLDQGLAIEHVALNLATADFRSDDIEDVLIGALEKNSLSPHRLQIEVTEMVLMENHVARPLTELRKRGVRVALDDFGTGFASLTHLVNFPVDAIKIDRSFVERLQTDLPSAAIVEALADIARKTNLDVVAEGIETYAQAEKLAELGCRLGQGYLFSRPADAATVADLLRATLPVGDAAARKIRERA